MSFRAFLLLGLIAPAALAQTGHVPLCAGLTIVTAVSQPEGDYESIKTIESVDGREMSLRYSAERREGAVVQKTRTRRRVLTEDLRHATLYLNHFHNRGALTVPGTTALGTSADVLQALKRSGSAELGLFEGTYSASPADPSVHPNIYDYKTVERIRRTGAAGARVQLLVNDSLVALPVIEAHANYTGDQATFVFLDDDANPLALRYRIGKDVLDVVKLSYRCARSELPAGAFVSRIEEALARTGRADVYSIYFSFASDVLREESDSTLAEIGGVLRRHPDWKLTINGHTDDIGDDASNLALSKRRAAAVREALIAKHGIVAARLTTAGYGERSPKDTNGTLEGRAHNRRVELMRMP